MSKKQKSFLTLASDNIHEFTIRISPKERTSLAVCSLVKITWTHKKVDGKRLCEGMRYKENVLVSTRSVIFGNGKTWYSRVRALIHLLNMVVVVSCSGQFAVDVGTIHSE